MSLHGMVPLRPNLGFQGSTISNKKLENTLPSRTFITF